MNTYIKKETWIYCHTRHYLEILSLAENLTSLSLQDGATTWYYFPKEPATHPPEHMDFYNVIPQ